jgi:hypothetical protein
MHLGELSEYEDTLACYVDALRWVSTRMRSGEMSEYEDALGALR